MTICSPLFHQQKIQQNFKRGLKKYNKNAKIQDRISLHLINRFLQLTNGYNFQHVLEIGCGTGFLTQKLVNNLTVDIWSINDLVHESKNYIEPILNDKVWNFLPGAIENISVAGNYDLIASSSSLQWIADTPSFIRRLCDKLKPGGWLMLSSFTPDHFHELQFFNTDPCIMSYYDSDAWKHMLPDNFLPKYIAQELYVAKFSTVRKMLIHLRHTGVNGNTRNQWTRQKLKRFEQEYKDQFSNLDKKIPLTYAPVYIIAQKPLG